MSLNENNHLFLSLFSTLSFLYLFVCLCPLPYSHYRDFFSLSVPIIAIHTMTIISSTIYISMIKVMIFNKKNNNVRQKLLRNWKFFIFASDLTLNFILQKVYLYALPRTVSKRLCWLLIEKLCKFFFFIYCAIIFIRGAHWGKGKVGLFIQGIIFGGRFRKIHHADLGKIVNYWHALLHHFVKPFLAL